MQPGAKPINSLPSFCVLPPFVSESEETGVAVQRPRNVEEMRVKAAELSVENNPQLETKTSRPVGYH